FIISGAFIIKATKHPTRYLIVCALIMNIFCMISTVTSIGLTIAELSVFNTVSYRNYGQAKLGREVSRILLVFYPLEFAVALTYSINCCLLLVSVIYSLTNQEMLISCKHTL
ncbi:PREDICTED: membrane-spanning 4-domains subfamily A member 13-like, partial [Galeopterus variegatus]|uniref:Membrane-spanning 4-domains subfamily A member 13-like n=1 Tax=Galeopterus variegatus TaxID=482537 RepID=A0ABM0SFP9_GALVR